MPMKPAASVKPMMRRTLDMLRLDVARRNALHLELQIRRPGIAPLDRCTMPGALANMARLGYRPASVLDAGAAVGTAALYAAFPDAHHVLIEPLEECEPLLRAVAADLRRADVFIGTAGASRGSATLNVHPDPSGSSLFTEPESAHVNGVPRTVEQETLDGLAARFGAGPPYFIKIDTQGSELEVLRGAEQTVLPATTGILVETSLFRFFEGGPLARDVIEYLGARGFVLYDVVDLQYRPLDGAMSQLDLLFVKTDDPLRERHYFATPQQRQLANERQIRKFRRAAQRVSTARQTHGPS
jgi:FkbM family methyltransferase